MIISISVALIVAGILLVALRNTGIPEIPIYLISGIGLSLFTSIAHKQGLVPHNFVEAEIMRELALLGLGILVFYTSSGMVVDRKRETAIKSFKVSLWISFISFAGFTALSIFLGMGLIEAVLFGVAAAVSSTLLNSSLVKEKARSNHIHGWLTEDMGFYDHVFGVVILSSFFSYVIGNNPFVGLGISLSMVLIALRLRGSYSSLMLKVTDGKDELVLLLGISTLISAVWITEAFGITALAGIYTAGLIFVDTDLGFKVRERFTAVKDFFTALSFFAIGYLVSLPSTTYLLMAAALVLFITGLRPLIASQMLDLQVYDLRTGFMASIQSGQVSGIVVLGSILMIPFAGVQAFETLAIVFTVVTVIAHAIEDREHNIFERLFSNYELDSEKSSLPEELDGHVILAGYDWKTRGLEDIVEDRQVVVADYNLESIEKAEERGIPHLLADLYSDNAWDKLRAEDASLIVSAVSDRKLMEKIEGLDLDAEKILVKRESEEVNEQLREMLNSALDR